MQDVNQSRIEAFLAGDTFAVAGASSSRAKYGNKVLRAYLQRGMTAYPVNPRGGEIEGLTAYESLSALPRPPHGVSIVTPPAATELIVDEAIRLGVRHIWMQPGAESEPAIRRARDHGLNVIADGPCVLVALRYREN